jgi:transcriptional regulator with XRE-family HTH domain
MAMQMRAILDRITLRREELGLSEAAVAQKGGSRDLIRNWRRALDKGQTISARYDSLQLIARALGVSEDWLIHGKGQVQPAMPRVTGMSESVMPFSFDSDQSSAADSLRAVRAIFDGAATTPGLFKVGRNLPAFEIASGDVVLADLARLPEPGELALVSVTDDQTATSKTLICRYLPPYLTLGKIGPDVAMLRVDDSGVTVRHPVVGSIRGIPDRKD